MRQRIFTNKEVIEEFIKTYRNQKITIESSVIAAISTANQYEIHLNKYFYQFTKEEILKMYKDTHSISTRSLQNRNLILKDFTYYIIENRQLSIKNIYEDITRKDLSKCIDQNKKDNGLITREQLTGIQNNLNNYTDKGILEALFLGFGGNKLKELTFFDLRQIQKQNKTVVFENGKAIHLNDRQYILIAKAYFETSLTSSGTTGRTINVISHGFFKERSNARTPSNNPQNEDDLNRRYRFIQRRLILISKGFDLPITSGRIQDSGLLYYLQNAIKESGQTFNDYITTESAKKLAQRYDIHTEFYTQILKEKFALFF